MTAQRSDNRLSRLTSLPAAVARHSLLRNSVYIMLTTGINSILGYVFWVIVTRSFSASEVGVAGALIAAMTLIAAIADLGTSRALVQRLPQQADDAEWSRTLTASVTTGGVAGLVMAVFAAVLILPAISSDLEIIGSSPGHVALFAVGVAVWSLSQITDYLFIAERRAGGMVARNLSFSAARILFLALLVWTLEGGALEILGVWVLATAFSVLAAYLLLVPRLGRHVQPDIGSVPATVRTMARPYAGNYLITIGDMLPQFLLPVLVIALLSAAENAYFYVAWLLGVALFTISSSVATALFAEGVHEPRRIAEQSRSAAKTTTALLTPLMAVYVFAGEWILGLFGSEYAEQGYVLLLILTASAVPDAVTNIYIARLRARERLRLPAALNLSMATVTLCVAAALLPTLGIEAVGIAWISAQLAGSAFALVETGVGRRPGKQESSPRTTA